jgi:hypothetical protein
MKSSAGSKRAIAPTGLFSRLIAMLILGAAGFTAMPTVLGQELTVFDPQSLYDAPGGLYDASILREMQIEFEDPAYHEILGASFFADPGLRIPATVTIEGVAHDSVGVRYKGNSTFCLPHQGGNVKVPYNLDFNYWVSGQEALGYKKVKLANAWLDPTFTKEYLAAQIYRKYLPTAEVNLLALHTQGQYTGLYVNTESINKQFLDKHFGENDGVLFKCDGAAVFCGPDGTAGSSGGTPSLQYLGPDSASYYDSYTIKTENGWGALQGLIETLATDPASLPEVLNIDRVLWAFAVNTVIGNFDTYNGYYIHNYYLYLDGYGRFQMMPWDLDNSFVGALMGFSFYSPADVYEFDPYFSGFDAADSRPLIDYLLSDPLYRLQYTAHMRTVMEESMDANALAQDIAAFQTTALAAAQSDANSLFGMTYFESNVNSAFWNTWGFAGILSTTDARMDFLSNHPEISENPPVIGEVYVVDGGSSGSNGTVEVAVSNATSVDLMVADFDDPGNFQPVTMVDDGTAGDVTPLDGVYTASFSTAAAAGEVHFYIRALNANALAVSPARAAYEYYIYSPSTGINSGHALAQSHNGLQWSVYPNPVDHRFSLKNLKPFSPLSVFNAQGQVMYAGAWEGRFISTVDWPSGMYWIHSGLGSDRSTQKFVVR